HRCRTDVSGFVLGQAEHGGRATTETCVRRLLGLVEGRARLLELGLQGGGAGEGLLHPVVEVGERLTVRLQEPVNGVLVVAAAAYDGKRRDPGAGGGGCGGSCGRDGGSSSGPRGRSGRGRPARPGGGTGRA